LLGTDFPTPCVPYFGLEPSLTLTMGAGARGPKLPKRSVIEKLTQNGPECVPEMMGLLTCFKDTGFNEAKCAAQMNSLSECVGRQVSSYGLLREPQYRRYTCKQIPTQEF